MQAFRQCFAWVSHHVSIECIAAGVHLSCALYIVVDPLSDLWRKGNLRAAGSAHQARSTVRHLGIEVDDVLAIAEQVNV